VKPEDAQSAPAEAATPAPATRQSPAVTRTPTKVARGVHQKGLAEHRGLREAGEAGEDRGTRQAQGARL
jgi:hypothetical protein